MWGGKEGACKGGEGVRGGEGEEGVRGLEKGAYIVTAFLRTLSDHFCPPNFYSQLHASETH